MPWDMLQLNILDTTLDKQGGREDGDMNATSSGGKSLYVVHGVTSKINLVVFWYFLMHLCPPQRAITFVTTVNNCLAEVQELNNKGITCQVRDAPVECQSSQNNYLKFDWLCLVLKSLLNFRSNKPDQIEKQSKKSVKRVFNWKTGKARAKLFSLRDHLSFSIYSAKVC